MSKPTAQRSPYENLGRDKRAAPAVATTSTIAQRYGDRSSSDDAPAHQFLTGPAVCARYQITDISLHRWLADEQLGFPQPAMRVNGRRFWLESDLLEFERSQIKRDARKGKAEAAA